MLRPSNQSSARDGFTIVEILVVVAIILVLLSLVIVAVGSATRTAQRTNTSALMGSIKQSLVQFQNDVGYLPPILDHQRNIEFELPFGSGQNTVNGPNPNWNAPGWNALRYKTEVQEWYSVTALAEYLIGYGPVDEDGHDGPGIRNPGPDGFWGATNPLIPNPGIFRGGRGPDENGNGGWLNPNGPFASQSVTFRQGKVLGPYLQLRDDRLLGAINPEVGPDANGRFQVFFPGEAGYNDTWPKVIVDYWGEVIRYYRKPYPVGGISRGYRQVSGQDFEVPTLADVFLLRRYDIQEDRRIDSRFEDNERDHSASYELMNAEFGLFSGGPDQRFNARVRYDAVYDDVNRDNIVEVGP